MKEKIYIPCDCGHAIVEFNYDETFNMYYISFYKRYSYNDTLWQRIKWVWRVIRNKSEYWDDIVLKNDEKVNELIEYLKKNNNKEK